jgi:murein L,D-transpeptidase YafK
MNFLFANYCLSLFIIVMAHDSFLIQQMRFQRVRAAFEEKQATIDSRLKQLDIPKEQINLYFRAFKQEEILEAWVKTSDAGSFSLYREIPFCQSSGTLGPKMMKGDLQIPEGVYHIDRFNPESKFYLSLGINYPNLSDLKHADAERLGGDIFIHGNCVTVGCIPITDDKIKEIYALAVLAKSSGQTKIPVHIFPSKTMTSLIYQNEKNHRSALWHSLEPIQRYFDENFSLPKLHLNNSGYYQMN